MTQKTCASCKKRIVDACTLHLSGVRLGQDACSYYSPRLFYKPDTGQRRRLSDRAVVLLLLLVFLLPSLSFAAPIEYGGKCYATDSEVVEVFKSRLLVSSTSGQPYSYSGFTLFPSSPGGVFSIQYTVKTNNLSPFTATAIFQPCGAGQAVEQPSMSLNNVLILLAAIFLFVFGFRFAYDFGVGR